MREYFIGIVINKAENLLKFNRRIFLQNCWPELSVAFLPVVGHHLLFLVWSERFNHPIQPRYLPTTGGNGLDRPAD